MNIKTSSNAEKSEEINLEISRKEVNLKIYLYILSFFIIYFGSFIIPGFIVICYILFFFIPFILSVSSFWLLLTAIPSLITLITWPLVLIGSYLIHLFSLGLLTRLIWKFIEGQAPSKEGKIPRNKPSRELDYYFLRSFVIKYGKFVFNKGPIPWLSNWFYNYVGASEIGKGTTIEENSASDRIIEIGDNVYIGVNSALASHIVDGNFRKISYFKIKVGDNATMGGFNCLGPGSTVGDNSYLLPFACGGKHYILKGNNYYFGQPLKRIVKKKLMEFLDLDDKNMKINQ